MVETNSINKPQLSLDEVFVKKKASNSTHEHHQRIRLTPLSNTACRIHDRIDPSALIERDHASFGEPDLDPEIQSMRYEAYAFTRNKLYQLASAERSKLAAKTNTSSDSMSVSGHCSVSIVSSNSSGREATLIENERKRLEKMANRQKKELLRLLAFESKSQEIMSKMKDRTEEQEKKEAKLRAGKRRRSLEAAEQARQREILKHLEEEEAKTLAIKNAEQKIEKDRKIQQEKLKREREMKKKAMVEEKRRIEKREEHRVQIKKLYEEQSRKPLSREQKERELNDKLELKRLVNVQAAEEKRKDRRRRIENNLAARRRNEASKRSELLRRQAKQEEIKNEKDKERAKILQKQKQRSEVIGRKRKHQFECARENERAAKQAAENKMQLEEAHLEAIARQRNREQMLIKAERELQLQMKQDNLERLKRKQEFRHKEIMRKVQENDERTQALLRQKEELMHIRRKNAHKAKIEKDHLLSVLEQSKAGCSSSIQKLLKQVSLRESNIEQN